LGNAVNFSLLSITEEHAGILTLHVNGHDGRALPEIAHVIGMTGMSKLVLDRHEVNPLPGDAQLLQQDTQFREITTVATVAIEDGIQPAVRRVPVPVGVVPAGGTEDRHWRIGYGDGINITRLDPCRTNAVAGRLTWHAFLRVASPG